MINRAIISITCLLLLSTQISQSVGVQQACPEDEQQFIVVVSGEQPLGLRLSEKLEIRAFVPDSEGRSRVVEASGLAELGDCLIAVNNISLSGLTLEQAVNKIKYASLPKSLHFQTYDRRCVSHKLPTSAPSSSISEDKETVSSTIVVVEPVVKPHFDYLIVSVGDVETDRQYFAVLSDNGKPPSCEFRSIRIAVPYDACAPLTVNVSDSYVIVPSALNCPAHQKAALVQEAGGKGVILVQKYGLKPLKIKVDADSVPDAIRIPLIMVSYDSGVNILGNMGSVPPGKTIKMRLVLNEDCAAEKYAVHPDEDPLDKSVQYQTQSAKAGFLLISTAALSTASTAVAYEFIKPQRGNNEDNQAKFSLGKHAVTFPFENPCENVQATLQRSTRKYDHVIVVFHVDPQCSIMQQVTFFTTMGADGVILADPNFPDLAYEEQEFSSSVPIVIISSDSFAKMTKRKVSEGEPELFVEFSADNALYQHWFDLMSLSNPQNWPSHDDARDRLFYRVLRDQQNIQVHSTLPIDDERYNSLVTAYWKAKKYYNPSKMSISEISG